MGNNTSTSFCSDEANRDAQIHNTTAEDPNDHRKYLSPAYFECERKMLGHTGVPVEDIKSFNVVIDD
jgi:abhydrolase domain-containing protein 5